MLGIFPCGYLPSSLVEELASARNMDSSSIIIEEKEYVGTGTSLVVQWVRLCTPNAGGWGSIPGQGTGSHMHAATKSPHAATVSPDATTKDPACRNEDPA